MSIISEERKRNLALIGLNEGCSCNHEEEVNEEVSDEVVVEEFKQKDFPEADYDSELYDLTKKT